MRILRWGCWLGLLWACSGGEPGSATVRTAGPEALAVGSALYAQAQLVGRSADANGQLPAGTLLGVYLFSQKDACAALQDLRPDVHGLLSGGPPATYPWLRLAALRAGVGLLQPGDYVYLSGTPSGDLPAMPAATGTLASVYYPSGLRTAVAAAGSALHLGRVDGNVEDGRVEGNFLLSDGANGTFSARYCAALAPLLSSVDAP